LIDALKFSDISVDVLGHGELYSEIKDQIKKNNVNVKFLKTIPNNKMAELYNHYAVYVICSNYEGNPKTLLEAMSCGCAVVGTDVSGIREIIQHEKTGLLVSQDSEMLRDAILRLISSDKLCESLGRAASSYILKHNSFNSALEHEYETYKKLTDS
jgi:glycosyltransferase involved in cell wall biosynthesis